jgi:hypothetical protein
MRGVMRFSKAVCHGQIWDKHTLELIPAYA